MISSAAPQFHPTYSRPGSAVGGVACAPPRRFNLPPLEALQRAYGFEEDEAVAFWHLRRAGSLMNQMRSADLHDELDRHEGQDGQELRQQAILLDSTLRWHSTVGQHFAALIRELGNRVLRRNFPDGWGKRTYGGLDDLEDEEEG
jgi:hypothetical protein